MAENTDEEKWEKVFMIVGAQSSEGRHKIEIFEPSGKPISQGKLSNRRVESGINNYSDRTQYYAVIDFPKVQE